MATKPELRRAVANSYIKASDYNYNFEQLNNYIEAGTALATYEPSAEYKKNQWVLAEVGGEFGIYQSLVDGNKGTSLLDGTYWEKVSLGAGLEIGDIGIAPLGIDETKGKRRYLNGQVIIQEQYVQFTNKVKSAVALYPSLACTESEWQATALLTVGGQVGKFVVDDDAGTIRLPKIIMPIQGLTDLSKLGEIVEAGLPNVTGTAKYVLTSDNTQATGAITQYPTNSTLAATPGNGYLRTTIDFDASRSSSIYGNSTTVQQEQIQYPYFIQVATGAETEDNIINEIELNNPFSLLDYKYSEYELNNLSWLRSNGQYNSKAVYPSVYDLLLKIYNGTETKAGVSVKLSSETFTDYDFVLNTSDETFRLPIKVKLASGKAVVGNGISLGITDGSNYFGVIAPNVNPYPMQALTNMYGVGVGHSGGNGAYLSSNVAVGVTTDPTKSGIETSDSNLYLYFYVGETVQNANLINAGRIEEQLATKVDKFDAYKHSIPDYTNTIQVGNANNSIAFTSYTAPVSGLLNLGWGAMTNATNTIKILVNGHGVAWGHKTGIASFTTSFPVNAGDVVTWQLATGTSGDPYVHGFLCPYKEGGN